MQKQAEYRKANAKAKEAQKKRRNQNVKFRIKTLDFLLTKGKICYKSKI